MNKDYLKVVNSFQDLGFFNKKNSETFVYDFLKNKKNYQKSFAENLEKLESLEFCSKCGTVREILSCKNCDVKKESIYIFEDFSDFFALGLKIEKIEKSFILNIFKKSEYLDETKMNLILNRTISFLGENEITKEIIFMISPSFESEVFKRLLKSKLSKKIKYNEIPLGIPLNSKIKYYDTNLLKDLISKNEKTI